MTETLELAEATRPAHLVLRALPHSLDLEVRDPSGAITLGLIRPARPVRPEVRSPRPPLVFGSWEAVVGRCSQRAVSAAAAQVLILRASAARVPSLVPPRWADQVRPLSLSLGLKAQALATDRHIQRVISPERFAALTAWEQRQIGEGTLNLSLLPGAAPGDRPYDIPTPLQVNSLHSLHSRLWSVRAAADYLRVGPSTIRSWVARAQMPAYDGASGRMKWWHADTIRQWHRQRPLHT